MNTVKTRLHTIFLTILLGFTSMAQAETVLITGSNQGIGLAFAKQYAAMGWTVIATHRRDTIPETLAALHSEYPNVRVETMDVTRQDHIQALAEKLKGEPIDILLHNAALIRFDALNDPEGNRDQLFGTLDYDHFDMFMRTNVAGPLMITEAFIEHVKASNLKKIVAISSAAGMVSVLPRRANHYWYYISKAALNSAMRLLTVQFKDEGITVVMFHPGGVQVESFGDLVLPGAMSPEEATGHMVNTIAGLTVEDSGRFLRFDGEDMPW